MTIQTHEQAHSKARALRTFLQANGCTLGLRKSLDAVAVVEGLPNWNTLSARLNRIGVAAPSAASVEHCDAPPGQKLAAVTNRLLASLGKSAALAGDGLEADVHFALTSPQTMALRVFSLLQSALETREMQVARGEDARDGIDEEMLELDHLLELAPWSLHPDWGIMPKARRDAGGRQVPHRVFLHNDSSEVRERWYWALETKDRVSQVNGPYGDILDMVQALDERFEDVNVAYELEWQANSVPDGAKVKYLVCQDHGEYTDVGTRLSEAVQLARDMRDSGAGGTWTVETRDGRVVAVFR